jgi:hypothetical protein
MNTYKNYLNHPAGDVLTIEDALDIYERMTASIEACSFADKTEFWNDLLKGAAEYTKVRNDWELMSREERMETDKSRTMTHDGFITSLNLISKIAEKEGQDISWRMELGEERKRLGDFACFVSYITGISNR